MSIDVRLESSGGGKYWCATWTDHNGKRRRKSLGPKAKIGKREANRLCRKLAVQAEAAGTLPSNRSPAVLYWLRTYLKQNPNYAAGTAKLYHQAVKHLCTWRKDQVCTMVELQAIEQSTVQTEHAKLDGMTRLNHITRAAAADFRAHLLQVCPTETTVDKHMRTLRSLFGAAVDQDRITMNPFKSLVGSAGDLEDTWEYVSLEEFDRLLESCPSSGWRAFFALGRLAGLRLNEACHLQWGNIDFERRVLRVVNPGRKKTTKKRTRTVPISPQLHQELLARFEAADAGESVIGMSYGSFNGSTGKSRPILNAIIEKAKVDHYGKPFHTLRKSLETDWLSARHSVGDVCKWLGNSATVAMKHYHKTTDQAMRAITHEEDEKDVVIKGLKAENEKLRAICRKSAVTFSAMKLAGLVSDSDFDT